RGPRLRNRDPARWPRAALRALLSPADRWPRRRLGPLPRTRDRAVARRHGRDRGWRTTGHDVRDHVAAVAARYECCAGTVRKVITASTTLSVTAGPSARSTERATIPPPSATHTERPPTR